LQNPDLDVNSNFSEGNNHFISGSVYIGASESAEILMASVAFGRLTKRMGMKSAAFHRL
jgi:hypothetical protein